MHEKDECCAAAAAAARPYDQIWKEKNAAFPVTKLGKKEKKKKKENVFSLAVCIAR